MNNEGAMVTIPLERYDTLCKQETKYRTLVTTLLREADENKYADELCLHFDDRTINAVLRAIESTLYSARIFELKAETEADKARKEEAIKKVWEDGNND